MNPLFPSKTPSGPVIPRSARKVAWVAEKATRGPSSGRARARSCHTERIIDRAGYVDAVGGLHRGETKGPRDSRSHRTRPLRRVVESPGSHRRHVGEAALDLIGHGQGGEKLLSAPSCILAGSKYRCQIVTGVTGLARGEVAIVEVQVADQRAVVEGCPVRSGLPAPDQCDQRISCDRSS